MSLQIRRAAVLLLAALSPLSSLAQESVQVRVEPLSNLVIHPELSAPAQVLSLNDSRIEADIMATVKQFSVRVGDVVEANVELLRLECGDQGDQLQQSRASRDALKARVEFADFQYARARSLVKSRNISDEQLRQRKADALALKAELEGAEASLLQAQRNVDRCTIKAPFEAVVMERLIGVGEKAQPGKPLLHLLDLSALEVSAQVSAFDSSALSRAQSFILSVGGKNYPLALRAVVPALDPRSRSREIRLEFTAARAQAGDSGRLLWRQSEPHLPAEYLLRRDGRYGVFVLRGEKAEFVVIDGAREGSPVKVMLPATTLVVTEGRFNLKHDNAVSVVK